MFSKLSGLRINASNITHISEVKKESFSINNMVEVKVSCKVFFIGGNSTELSKIDTFPTTLSSNALVTLSKRVLDSFEKELDLLCTIPN